MTTRRLVFVAALALASVSCGGGGGGTSSTGAETSAEGSGSETGEDMGDGHGTIRVEIAPLAGELDILADTAEIVATVHYEGCLRDFYLTAMPSMQQDGVDGAAIFADWTGRLCTEFTDTPPCSVTSVQQTLLEANEVYSLTVTYAIDDPNPAALAYRELRIGPLPTEALAGCEAGQTPRVEMRQTGLAGRNAQGDMIWRISSLPAQNSAVTDQGAPLRVEVTES